MSQIPLWIRDPKAFAKLQAERVKQAEQVVKEAEAANERCNGCGRKDVEGSMIKGRWYCGSCKSSTEHEDAARAAAASEPLLGGGA